MYSYSLEGKLRDDWERREITILKGKGKLGDAGVFILMYGMLLPNRCIIGCAVQKGLAYSLLFLGWFVWFHMEY